jgi:tetratricopeptide (TPR) repeat protein
MVSVLGPMIVLNVSAFLLNRLANNPVDQIPTMWELYAFLALAGLTAAGTFSEKRRQAQSETRRSETIGFAEVYATRNFSGPGADIANLTALMRGEVPNVVLCGGHGTGKSVLAREYAYRNRARYQFVWWLSAKSEEDVVDGLVRLSAVLGADVPSNENRRSAAERVVRDLGDLAQPALLVFDDLDDEALLRWNASNHFRILATSNKPAAMWRSDVVTLSPTPWSEDDAVRYLERECRPFRIGRDEARQISRIVDRLPLALSHAAGHLRATPLATVAGYVAHLTDRLGEVPPDTEYPRAVAATFEESVASAERESPGAAAIIALSAYYARLPIPIEYLTQDAEVYAHGLQPSLRLGQSAASDLQTVLSTAESMGKACGTLQRASLIDFYTEAHAFEVGALMQTIAMSWTDADCDAWAQTAVASIWAVVRGEEASSSATSERHLAHARAALAALPPETTFVPGASLAMFYADYLQEQDVAEAEHLARLALAIYERTGDDDESVARALQTLSSALAEALKLPEALETSRRALARAERAHGPESVEVLRAMNRLSQVLYDTNAVTEAEAVARDALEISEREFGPDSIAVAVALRRLGRLLTARGELAEAEMTLRRALLIMEQEYGPNSVAVAGCVGNLGTVLRQLDRQEEAIRMQRRAFAIERMVYGRDHPYVGVRLANLAESLTHTTRLDEAERYARRAMTISEATFGAGHPRTSSSLSVLGHVLFHANEFREAEILFRRVLEMDETTYGRANSIHVATLNHLGLVLARTNRKKEAAAAYRRAIDITTAIYGDAHADAATNMFDLALLLRETGDPVQAEELNRRALAVLEVKYGDRHHLTISCRDNLADLLRAKGHS